MALRIKSSFPFVERSNASTLADPDAWLVEALLGRMKASSGVAVTPLTALGVTTVLACVQVIARQIATIPLQVYEQTPQGKRKAVDHPLYSLLHDSPNDDMTAAEFRLAMQGNLTLRNNAAALIERNGRAKRLGEGRMVAALTPVDPIDFEVVLEDRAFPYRVKGLPKRREDVLHLRGLSLSGLMGLDTVGLARDAIGLAIALQDDVARFFANGAKVGTILATDQNLDADKAAKLKERFDSRHKGDGRYSTAVLSNGLKLLSERFSGADAESKDQRDFQARQIAQVFNVPLHKVQILDSLPRANVEEQNIQFITDCLRPYVVMWEQGLTKWLLNPEERARYSIAFNLEGLLRGATKDRYEAYQIGRLNGWLSVNEIRSLEDMNSIGPAGDTYIEPMNHQPVGTKPAGAATEGEEEDVA